MMEQGTDYFFQTEIDIPQNTKGSHFFKIIEKVYKEHKIVFIKNILFELYL